MPEFENIEINENKEQKLQEQPSILKQKKPVPKKKKKLNPV